MWGVWCCTANKRWAARCQLSLLLHSISPRRAAPVWRIDTISDQYWNIVRILSETRNATHPSTPLHCLWGKVPILLQERKAMLHFWIWEDNSKSKLAKFGDATICCPILSSLFSVEAAGWLVFCLCRANTPGLINSISFSHRWRKIEKFEARCAKLFDIKELFTFLFSITVLTILCVQIFGRFNFSRILLVFAVQRSSIRFSLQENRKSFRCLF